MHTLQNKFVIVVPTFNAGLTIIETLESIIAQEFKDLGIIIRDDMSTDDTHSKIQKFLKIKNSEIYSGYFTGRDILLIRNKSKFYGAGNTFDSVINYIDNPNTIVGVVDGDDVLLDKKALLKIEDVYKYSTYHLVWSQHQLVSSINNNKRGFSQMLPPDDEIYNSRDYWSVSHFRTCKAWLYSHIDPNDLMDPFIPNSFCKVAADAALLYPLIEMCGNEKSYFLDEELYLYKNGLDTNECIAYSEEVKQYTHYIRNISKRYSKYTSRYSNRIKHLNNYY